MAQKKGAPGQAKRRPGAAGARGYIIRVVSPEDVAIAKRVLHRGSFTTEHA